VDPKRDEHSFSLPNH